jgi:ribosomal protein S18 acetylase RimI-like enzyme
MPQPLPSTSEKLAVWTLYEHRKGRLYLGLGPARHSESEDVLERYLCLYDAPLGAAWVRPAAMFHDHDETGRPRFTPLATIRVVMPEDEATVLPFGHDAWGAGKSLAEFVAGYATSRNHLRGTRYLLESLDGRALAGLNTLRFRRGIVGIASVATNPTERRRGHATRLLSGVLALLREQDAATRFLLFSEVDPAIYERVGFTRMADAHQHHLPSIAMATNLAERPLGADDARYVETYF